MTDPELDGRLLDAVERLMRLRREARTGAARGYSLLGIMSVVHDLHTYVLEQTAEQIRKDSRP